MISVICDISFLLSLWLNIGIIDSFVLGVVMKYECLVWVLLNKLWKIRIDGVFLV